MFIHIATICIVYLQFTQIQTKTINETEIKILEKQKQDLLKEINEAIKDSVKVLEKTNDSESLVSLNFINQIKNNINDINDGVTDKRSNDTVTARRSKNVNMHLFDVVNLPHESKKHSKNGQIKLENQAKMQARIDEWLYNREKEREKIKKMRESFKNSKPEVCPRWGVGQMDKKKDKDKKKNKDGSKYPCCRKCCKKSYMGCL